mmetsp:Transcript_33678/g.58693  ORF Transcript_33678/g.58693 Transcript_33678/m.58693 type:complete len:85 (+) Transcript_33678:54-308(+)
MVKYPSGGVLSFWWSSTSGGALIQPASALPSGGDFFSLTTVLLCPSVHCGGALFCGIVRLHSNTAVCLLNTNRTHLQSEQHLMT